MSLPAKPNKPSPAQLYFHTRQPTYHSRRPLHDSDVHLTSPPGHQQHQYYIQHTYHHSTWPRKPLPQPPPQNGPLHNHGMFPQAPHITIRITTIITIISTTRSLSHHSITLPATCSFFSSIAMTTYSTTTAATTCLLLITKRLSHHHYNSTSSISPPHL